MEHNDHLELSALMERVIHKFTQWEGQKRTYGTELLLSKAEIHTIAAIGDHPGINITMLSATLGITKGAASQMIYKLVDKRVVEKKTSPDSDSEVMLNLTADGLKNYEAHRQFHQQTNDQAWSLLRDMPDSFCADLISYLSAFERIIDKQLKEKQAPKND